MGKVFGRGRDVSGVVWFLFCSVSRDRWFWFEGTVLAKVAAIGGTGLDEGSQVKDV